MQRSGCDSHVNLPACHLHLDLWLAQVFSHLLQGPLGGKLHIMTSTSTRKLSVYHHTDFRYSRESESRMFHAFEIKMAGQIAKNRTANGYFFAFAKTRRNEIKMAKIAVSSYQNWPMWVGKLAKSPVVPFPHTNLHPCETGLITLFFASLFCQFFLWVRAKVFSELGAFAKVELNRVVSHGFITLFFTSFFCQFFLWVRAKVFSELDAFAKVELKWVQFVFAVCSAKVFRTNEFKILIPGTKILIPGFSSKNSKSCL